MLITVPCTSLPEDTNRKRFLEYTVLYFLMCTVFYTLVCTVPCTDLICLVCTELYSLACGHSEGTTSLPSTVQYTVLICLF